MPNNTITKTLLLLCMSIYGAVFSQETELLNNEDCLINYSIKDKYLTITVEDKSPLSNKTKSSYSRIATNGDFGLNGNYIMIEFDSNNNKKFDEQDIGLYIKDYRYSIEAYSLKENYNGLYIYKLNKGFDKHTAAKLLNYSDQSNKKQWKIQVPLKELIADVSNSKLNFQISINRELVRTTNQKDIFLELPNKRNDFENTFEIALDTRLLVKEENQKKADQISTKMDFSKKQVRAKIDYDGVFIDPGNGKYVEMVSTNAEKGELVGLNGNRVSENLFNTYYLTSLTKTVVVPKLNKIILSGSMFGGDFLKYVSFHEMEDMKSLKITKADGRGGQLNVYVIKKQGSFNSSFDNTLDNEPLYNPRINKSKLNQYDYIDYNTKTIDQNRIELTLSSPLQKGKTYCLWSGSFFYLFEIQ